MNDKLQRGWPNLLASAFVCGVGIAAVWHLTNTALNLGIDGVALATASGIILAVILAFTGIKIKDVLFK